VIWGALALAPVLVGQFVGAFLIGAGAVRVASLVNVCALGDQGLGYLGLALVHQLTPTSAVIVWFLAATGLAIVDSVLAWRHDWPGALRTGLPTIKRGMAFALASWTANGLSLLALRADMFFLAFYLDAGAVGVYSIAVTLAELSWYVPTALNSILLPKVASEGEEASLDVTVRLTRTIWPFTLVVSGAVGLAAVFVVPFLFGAPFRASIVPLVLLTPGIVFSAIASLPTAYMAGIGRPIDATKATLVNVIVNVVANVVLIPVLGVPGAALASTLSYGAGAVVIVFLFVRRTGVRVRNLLIPKMQDFRVFWTVARAALSARFPDRTVIGG
jgi:O-antigen/teichoic acid export membrane protein